MPTRQGYSETLSCDSPSTRHPLKTKDLNMDLNNECGILLPVQVHFDEINLLLITNLHKFYYNIMFRM